MYVALEVLAIPTALKGIEGSIMICFSTVALAAACGLRRPIYPILCAPRYEDGLHRDASRSCGRFNVTTSVQHRLSLQSPS